MDKRRPFWVRAPQGSVDLDRLARMGPQELQELFRDLLGRDIPSGNTEYARRKIAWHLQAEREGGLPESARQHALAIARDSKLRLRLGINADRLSKGLPLEHSIAAAVVSDHDSRLPMPGSILIRKHKHQTLVVKVLGSDFEYDGRRFASLSAIAKEVTGTKWNGFAFFGLTKEVRRGR